MNKIINADFLANELPDGCADLIIADPPYYRVKGEFDFIWPDFAAYLIDVEKWADEMARLLADNGTLFYYGDPKRIAYAQIILDKRLNLLNSLVWYKGGHLHLEHSEDLRSFAPCTERVLMYSKDTLNLTGCVYVIRDYIREQIEAAHGVVNLRAVNEVLGTATNGGGVASACLSLDKTEPAMITRPMYEKLKAWCSPLMAEPYENLREKYEAARAEYEETRRPFNNIHLQSEVLQYSNEATKTGAKYDHDTVKPETLTRVLIQTCSRVGDLVVIPFAGSGTECAMAAKEKRNFIGYEIEPKYCEMATKRVRQILRSPELF